MASRTILCLDTASPTVSVAAARDGALLAEQREPIARSSVRLLPMIDDVLQQAEVPRNRLGDLAALVVLGGPGSFTGLRVGMATALGLHQASGAPATAVPSFDALANWWQEQRSSDAGAPLWAVVDVLRGEWAVEVFETGAEGATRRGEPRRLPTAEVLAEAGAEGGTILGFGARKMLTDDAGEASDGRGPQPAVHQPAIHEPDALAAPTAVALSLAPPVWDAAALTRPIYFRPPAVTLPGKR